MAAGLKIVFYRQSLDGLGLLLLIIGLLVLLRGVLHWLSEIYGMRIAFLVKSKIRERLFQHILNRPGGHSHHGGVPPADEQAGGQNYAGLLAVPRPFERALHRRHAGHAHLENVQCRRKKGPGTGPGGLGALPPFHAGVGHFTAGFRRG